MDLWAETYLIDGGTRLGKFIGAYREAYFRPVRTNPFTGMVYSYGIRPGAEETIYRKIADISVSMKALDYLDMPECVMVSHYAEMDEEDKEIYDKMKEELAFVELKVGAVLAKLSDERLYDFMVNRFLDFMTIEAAANEVGFSYSWGRLAVERGVAEVQEILDGMEADGKFEGSHGKEDLHDAILPFTAVNLAPR